MKYYIESSKKLPVDEYDVVVAGGGTGGVLAAIAAARNGAKTVLIESKGYPGGTVVEGGTALHSFYNIWKPYDNVEKRQIVNGLPKEIIDRLISIGGSTGHSDVVSGYDYDCVSTIIDTELYKLVAFEMLSEANVACYMNTLLTDSIVEDGCVKGVIVENRGGRRAIMAKSFIDATGHGDLCAYSGAKYDELCDYRAANSIGVGGVKIDEYYEFLKEHNSLKEVAYGIRSGRENEIVRICPGESGEHIMDTKNNKRLPKELLDEAAKIGMAFVTTTVHDGYFMFIKLNTNLGGPSTNMELVNKAELELRKRQYKAIKILRKYVKGCENAYITRTSPSLNVRRGRTIECDYDISYEEISKGTHFEDDIFTYGFHDAAPRLRVEDGKTYGLPYRAICVKGLENLYAIGMMITKDHDAHMSTRNTVSCMGMGQGAGIAASLCVKNNCSIRELSYKELRKALLDNDVFLEEVKI